MPECEDRNNSNKNEKAPVKLCISSLVYLFFNKSKHLEMAHIIAECLILECCNISMSIIYAVIVRQEEDQQVTLCSYDTA